MEEHTHEGGSQELTAQKQSIAARFLERGLHNTFLSDGVITALLAGLTFLLPVFFIPSQAVTVEFAKIILLGFVVIVGSVAWAGMCLRDGYVSVPKSLVLLLSFLILISFVLSAFFSPTPLISFAGVASEIGTVSSMLSLFLLLYLASLAFRTRDRVLYMLVALLASSLLLAAYHLIRYTFGPILGFGIFTTDVATPAGKWNDFAVLMGGMSFLSILVLYFFSRNKSLKIPALLIFLLALFFLIVIDFTILWMILFAVTAGFILFAIYQGEIVHHRMKDENPELYAKHHKRAKRIIGHIPAIALILMLISFLYGSGIMTRSFNDQNQTLGQYVAQFLQVPTYSEVVLTGRYTAGIVTDTLKADPIFGAGPNRFSSKYLELKTTDLNRTPLWDATFDFGSGRIPTFIAMTGLVGMVFWLLFLIAMFLKVRNVYPLLSRDRIGAFLGITLFALVVYYWSVAFFYIPNISVFAMAFLLTGALIGFLVGEGVLGEYRARFTGSGFAAFVFTPLTVLVFLGAIASGVLIYQQIQSVAAFNQARIAISNGNIDAAEIAIQDAINNSDRDIYQRFKSSVALVKLQQVASVQGKDPNEVLSEADQLISVARISAERAVALDPTNAENYLALGGVYDTLAALGIQGAVDVARPNYERAILLNPKSPRLMFLAARLELRAGNRAKAKEYLYRALAERPNFLEGVSVLTQLELEDNKLSEAIAILRDGVAVEPTNFLLRFALGYLYYANREWKPAIVEFESAVFVNPVYADAKYFLGLAYMREGRKDEALRQFEGVQELNPENRDVTRIIRNIREGRQPFDAGIPTPTQPVSDALGTLGSETPPPQPRTR